MYYIGLDVHKRTISYCVKAAGGRVYAEGAIPATRLDLDRWMKTLPQPRTAAMEATVFTGWIYDHLLPHATALKVAHPLMLRAIAAAKKKNDRVDASKICDCLRCDFLPECYMASTAIRERRRTLRYRNLLVRQMVQMKNKTGTPLSKQRNKHLQTTLIEAAKMPPRFSPQLAMLYDRERQKGNANRATLAVARKLVAYLMAVDRGQRNSQVIETRSCLINGRGAKRRASSGAKAQSLLGLNVGAEAPTPVATIYEMASSNYVAA